MEVVNTTAFTVLSAEDLELLSGLADVQRYDEDTFIFRSGERQIDLFVCKSGQIDIVNPRDNESIIVSHGPLQFSGDIDVLTGRPVVISGIARAGSEVLRIKHELLRGMLMKFPRISDKFLNAFQARRELLSSNTNVGLKVIGPSSCPDTNVIREFLYKNFMPYTWQDSEAGVCQIQYGDGALSALPLVECCDGTILNKPSLYEVAVGAGLWQQCPSRDVDFAVIGAGPAGLAAAVYAASEGLSTLVLDRLGPGGQAGGSSKIENFLGFPSGISGGDLATRSTLQMLKFGAEIVAPVSVKSITPAAGDLDSVKLNLDCGAVINARVVLIATGVNWRKLDAIGADRFERAGVYYACTTVEAMLHDQRDVAVVGAGNSAGQAAMFLSECCPNRKVHLVIRNSLGPKMSEYLCGRIRASENITVHESTEITEVHGHHFIDAVTLKNKDGEAKLPVAAVFVFIGSDSSAVWLNDSIARDQEGFLLTGAEVADGHWPLKDREPCALETSMPRVLAAGDIRSGTTKRVGFAVGDGSQAVTCAHKLLSLIK